MTVLEIMERSGVTQSKIAVEFIKDAMQLIGSNSKDNMGIWTTNIIKGVRDYAIPADCHAIDGISILDSSDDRYKRIRRLTKDPTMMLDNSPET